MFNMMKTISVSTLTAIALAGAVSTPAFADHKNDRHAHQHDTRGDNDALVGGAIGALLGGVVGSEIAGSGNGTEGAILGALVGGAAGVAIADDGRDRRFDDRRFNDRRFDRRSDFRRGSDYYDYDYNYRRNRHSTYRGRSFDRYSHDRFGSRSSIHRGGFNSHRGNSFRKLKKLKKHH